MVNLPQIQYALEIPAPQTHYLELTLTIAGNRGGEVEVAMPSWSPGSYLMREFSRHVVSFAARSGTSGRGKPLAWKKTDKSTWRISGAGSALRLDYTVYAAELSVRTSHADESHAALLGTSVFMEVKGRRTEPCGLDVKLPRGWKIATGLGRTMKKAGKRAGAGKSEDVHFVAADYDELVDCPIEMGNFREIAFAARGVPHRLVLCGTGNEDLSRLAKDSAAIVSAGAAVFGDMPYASYTFLVHLNDSGRGGLEHRNSSSLLVDRFGFAPPKKYEDVLGLVAHEHFHTWNVKRIQPRALTSPDYGREAYTRLLWAMEGLTDYYEDLILRRAGSISAGRLLERLAERLQLQEELPGRLVQPLAESSFDTWIKYYRQNENTPNAAVSYYDKGSLVGWLLDLKLRDLTNGRRSLDDLMRRLYRNYARRGEPLAEDTVEREAVGLVGSGAAAEGAAAEIERFLHRHIHQAAEFDLSGLAAFGLTLVKEPDRRDGEAGGEGYLGVRCERRGERLIVANVLAGSPAWRDGINAEDEILALDSQRVTTEEDLAIRIQSRPAGARAEIAVFRRSDLRTLLVTLGRLPRVRYKLAPRAGAGARERRLFRAWARAELASLPRRDEASRGAGEPAFHPRRRA